MTIDELEFGRQVNEIVSIYKSGNSDTLDGNEVDNLIEHLRNQINLIEGNVTVDEYYQLEQQV